MEEGNMHLAGILIILLQVGFAVHVIKNGYDRYWLFLIIFVPLIGCILYTLLVIIPEARASRTVRDASAKVGSIIDPQRELRKRMDNFDSADTIDNRIALADELIKHGNVDEAILLYERSLSGPYAHDPHLLLGFAKALFHANNFARAREVLERLGQENPEFRDQDGHLLYARTLESLKANTEAIAEYEALCGYYAGAEAKCRYGLFLKKLGRLKEADAVFEDIIRVSRRVPKHSRRMNREWIKIAEHELA
jgi:hypothetical protein